MFKKIFCREPKRTFASVTRTLCQCGSLQRAADDSDSPIQFDKRTAEYQFVFGNSMMVIYHCPFCGGAAPESKRGLLFAQIPASERERLSELLEPIRSIDDAFTLLGDPDFNGHSRTETPETEHQAPKSEQHRDIRYYGLSDVADVWMTERPDGKIRWHLQGKYIGDRSPR